MLGATIKGTLGRRTWSSLWHVLMLSYRRVSESAVYSKNRFTSWT